MDLIPSMKISYDLAIAGIEDETNRARRLRDEGDLSGAKAAEMKIELYRRNAKTLQKTYGLDDYEL